MFSTRGSLKLLLGLILPITAQASSLQSAIEEGSVSGNLRAYYNTRDYTTRTDESAFALGGALRAKTARIRGTTLGIGFYTAQDLGTNNSNPAKVNKRLGSTLEVLGEAYLSISPINNTSLTLGRQKINTPFANPGDAFIIPFTFEAVSLTASLSELTLQLGNINAIKNRNSDDFVDVGKWSTTRYGVGMESTSGTLYAGANYNVSGLQSQLWVYRFADLFDMAYIQANYTVPFGGRIKPFVGVQYGRQKQTGDELLGTVDSTLYGLQGGAAVGNTKVVLAFNSVSEQNDSFNNGAFLAPYNFSTSTLFTNNMLQTMENVDAGSAAKATLIHTWGNLTFKVSYADFDFETAPDRDASDVDITYRLEKYVPGMSLRWRIEKVGSDTESVEQTNHRFQLQYLF